MNANDPLADRPDLVAAWMKLITEQENERSRLLELILRDTKPEEPKCDRADENV